MGVPGHWARLSASSLSTRTCCCGLPWFVGTVVSFSVRGPAGSAVTVEDLSSPITISIPVEDPSVPQYQRVCVFYNFTQQAWSSEGLVKDEEASNSTTLVCLSSHLSEFGADIDFTLEAPSVSADNFKPSNSYIIYLLFGSLYTFLGLCYLHAYIERRRYDIREHKIAMELIDADDEKPLPPPVYADGKLGFLQEWLAEFRGAIRTRHAWVAAIFPTGKKVFPKRYYKIAALTATISLALGMNAVFSYAATQNQNEDGVRTVNTMLISTVWGSARIPMEGIYSFFMVLPALLLMTICLTRYMVLVDILRKFAPGRFRNHELLRRLAREALERALEEGTLVIPKGASIDDVMPLLQRDKRLMNVEKALGRKLTAEIIGADILRTDQGLIVQQMDKVMALDSESFDEPLMEMDVKGIQRTDSIRFLDRPDSERLDKKGVVRSNSMEFLVVETSRAKTLRRNQHAESSVDGDVSQEYLKIGGADSPSRETPSRYLMVDGHMVNMDETTESDLDAIKENIEAQNEMVGPRCSSSAPRVGAGGGCVA